MDKVTEFGGRYRFLSNFFQSSVSLNGADNYKTVEHAFQAAKTKDAFKRQWFYECPTPGRAKRLGHELVLRPDWEEIKVQVMYDLLLQKFQILNLRLLLLATGDTLLEEGNTWGDTFWGVYRGVGKNHLGCTLMQVRTVIQEDLLGLRTLPVLGFPIA